MGIQGNRKFYCSYFVEYCVIKSVEKTIKMKEKIKKSCGPEIKKEA